MFSQPAVAFSSDREIRSNPIMAGGAEDNEWNHAVKTTTVAKNPPRIPSRRSPDDHRGEHHRTRSDLTKRHGVHELRTST